MLKSSREERHWNWIQIQCLDWAKLTHLKRELFQEHAKPPERPEEFWYIQLCVTLSQIWPSINLSQLEHFVSWRHNKFAFEFLHNNLVISLVTELLKPLQFHERITESLTDILWESSNKELHQRITLKLTLFYLGSNFCNCQPFVNNSLHAQTIC